MKELLEALCSPQSGFELVSVKAAPESYKSSPLAGTGDALASEVQAMLQFPDLAEGSFRLLHFKRRADDPLLDCAI